MGIFNFKKKERTPYIPFTEQKIVKGSVQGLIEKIVNLSLIVLIAGKRGSGKTSLGMKLLEVVNKKSKRKPYVVGYDKIRLPMFIKKTEELEKVPQNSVCLLDEGAILFSSRTSMKKSNKYLSNLMSIARHKNLTLFLIVQNSAMIDVNVLRLTDTLMFKEPSLLQTKFERKGIKEIYEKAISHFKQVSDKKSVFYVYDDDFEGLLGYSLPEFWSDKISRGFKNYR